MDVRSVHGPRAARRRRGRRQPPTVRRRRLRRREEVQLRGVLPPGEQLLDRSCDHALRQEWSW